jgi:multiple sugar transport system substrate-binding protein
MYIRINQKTKNWRRKMKLKRGLYVLILLALLLAACGGAAPEVEVPAEEASAEEPAEEAAEEPAEVEEAPAEITQIRWFVGLGTGTHEPQIVAQQAVVEAFNASQNEI